MDWQAFEILDEIKSVYDKKNIYGKIAQKLLVITFERLHFTVEPHEIEGLDIRAVKGTEKYALEVKTTEKVEGSFTLGEKDIKWIPEMQKQGYKTGYAVLLHISTENWIVGSSHGMKAGTNSVPKLRSQSFAHLENEINVMFDNVVKEIGKKLLEEKSVSPLQWLEKFRSKKHD